jgi:hypothetical protein
MPSNGTAMTTVSAEAHAATCLVQVAAITAYEFLADPAALSRWSLGCMDLVEVGNGIYTGRSLFDGGHGWLSIDGDPSRLLIDYHVGTLEKRDPRISVRIIPGPVCGFGQDACYVTLIAWRTASMSDERWQRLCASHDAEIWLIKSQVESRTS